ncbi:MAG: DNA-directed RNA polymerase subunit omega [Nitrospinae bacterium]|nr:DNA-directed RNA polymerase subunit omega [Nitrospinota bacterium]
MFNPELYNKALQKVPQKYLLANLIAMRMRQLIKGDPPMLDPEDMKPIDVALKEISEGLIEPRKEEITPAAELFG